jgi:hypothetical protein
MNMSAPPYIPDAGDQILEGQAFSRLWIHLLKGGAKRSSILLQDVLTQPEHHGIKNIVRQELMKIVVNSLGRAGFVGKPEDFKMQEQFRRILLVKQQQEGGMF